MEKKAVSLKRLLLLCVFVLMMGVILIPQPAHADGPPTIYWAVTSGNLVISDQEVQGDTKGNFPGTKAFTQSDRPGWIDTYVKTVRIEGRPRPMRTDYWFYFCMDLTDADLTGLDLSTCWSTVRMFGYCTSLKSVDLSKLGFSSYLQEMSYMFSNCSNLISVDMTDLKIPKCTRMDSMFSGCSKLAELDLSTTDLSGASDPSNYGMGSMLNGCSSLKKIVLGSTYQAAQVNFPYANHTDGYWICQETGAYYFGAESIPAGSGTYNYTTDIPEEYKAYWALTANGQNYDLVISPDQVTGDYSGQYYTLINPLAWEKSVSKDKIISVEFKTGAGGAKVKYNDLSFRINSSDVGLFDNYKNLQSVKLDGLDASACRRTYRMFCNCSSLTSVDLRGTGLASVDSAGAMFSGCTALTEVLFDPDNKVKFGNVSGMFYNCSSLEAVDLRSIDASTWTEARNTFSGCSKIKKLNCMDIDTGNIKNLQNMLDGCTSLELLLAGSSWDGEGWAEWYYNGPSLPHDMYEITRKNSDGSYYKLPKGTELQGDDRKSSVFYSIYVNEALLNNASELAKWEKLVEIAQDALKLSGITDPKEKRDAGIAALEAFEALPDEVQEYLPARYLGYIQDAANTVVPKEIVVKWSSIDGEDLTEPFIFNIPEGGIKVDSFLWDNKEALMEHFKKDGYSPFYILKSVGFKPISAYTNESDFYSDPDNIPPDDFLITENTTLYFYSNKSIGSAEITVDPLLCNTEITEVDQGIGPKWPDIEAILTLSGEDADKFITLDGKIAGRWKSAPDTEDYFYGTVKGDETYYLAVESKPMIYDLRAKFGYGVQGTELRINGAELVKSEETSLKKSISFVAKVTAVHDWDNGVVTTEPTETADGVRTYTCSRCGDTKTEPIPKLDPSSGGNPSVDPGSDPNQKGSDGTPVGPGASAAAAEKAITNMVTDDDPQGTVFGKVALKSPKQTKTSIDLRWNPVPNAASYVIFGNKCGKGNKPVKLGVVKGTRQTVSTVVNQKVAKGTYYKFVVVALDRNNTVVSTSKVIHVATKGGKVGNHKKVTVKKSVIKKARKLKKGKSLKLKAKAVPQSKKLKVRKHRPVLYESSDINIATVSKKGVVKAKNKGTCYIYAYAQNGVYKKIKVTVK